jgi:hypothetical protein
MGKGSGKGSGKGAGSVTDKPSFFEGFAGTTKGSFFEAPSWVDQTKAAGQVLHCVVAWSHQLDFLVGATSQEPSIENNPNWGVLLSGQFLFW